MTAPRDLGASLPRREALAKATGGARFTGDIQLPGMLHGAVLTSPYAHARILSCDVAAARALPGVKAVVTGKDIPANRFGLMVRDETALAIDKVRYVGDAVAAVAAVDRETAQCALSLIEVVYEELPAILDPATAMAAGAPIIHEELAAYEKSFDAVCAGNVLSRAEISAGDLAAAWRDCNLVVEGTYETQAQYHAYMEPVAAAAEADALGRITVWSSTQSVFRVQACISDALGIPRHQVRAISPYVGGGFGGKSEPGVQLIAALLSRAAKRPVKIVLGRDEDMTMMRSRHPARIRLRTGVKRDGTILVREGEVVMDGGAYADDSPAAMMMALYFLRGPYRVPAVRFTGSVVYTNKLRAGAFRGVGNAQATFACESQIDEIAEKLGIDPIEIRLRNAVRQGDSWLGGHAIGSASLAECLERVREESGWAARRARFAGTAPAGKRRGLGVSSVVYICAYLSTSAVIRLLDDGSVSIATGAVDIGQGSDTAIAQMCAAALRLDPEAVSVVQPDTDAVPYNSGTNASRVTYMLGRAVSEAATDVTQQIFRHAADMLECAAADLEILPGGRVAIQGVPGRSLSFREVSRRAHYRVGGPIIGRGTFAFEAGEIDPKLAIVKGFMPLNGIGTYVFGAQVVEVEVDETTGAVEVVEAWSAHDVGRAVNRGAVEGQIQGGFVQGLGYALIEELVWDGGRLANPSFMDYKIPGSLDVPYAIHPIIIENPEPTHPFGVKGVGEPPMIGVAAAVANAVDHAVGVRIRRLPITGERILAAWLEPAAGSPADRLSTRNEVMT
jgi:CO/xanthine dehydrogenase Mo-binding subunit